MVRKRFAIVLILAVLPLVGALDGCFQGTTQGAGRAEVTGPDEAKSDDPTISQTEDKFAGVTITNLRNNRLPDPSGNFLQELYFDATCVADACYVVMRLWGLAGATNTLDRLHLVIDGRVYPDLVGRQEITINGHTVRGDLVVPLDAETLAALAEATDVEYRVEGTRIIEEAVGSGNTGRRFEGKLSGENVLNVREMLSLAGMGAKVPEPKL